LKSLFKRRKQNKPSQFDKELDLQSLYQDVSGKLNLFLEGKLEQLIQEQCEVLEKVEQNIAAVNVQIRALNNPHISTLDIHSIMRDLQRAFHHFIEADHWTKTQYIVDENTDETFRNDKPQTKARVRRLIQANKEYLNISDAELRAALNKLKR
jgi:hypothetical protein